MARLGWVDRILTPPSLAFPKHSFLKEMVGTGRIWVGHPSNEGDEIDFIFLYAGFRPRATSHFCFGKSDQNHVRPCAERRGTGPPPRIRMAQKLAPRCKATSPLVWSFLLILEKLLGVGGGETTLRICQLLDRRFETSPIHTLNVDEESCGIPHDRRFGHKLTLVWPTPLTEPLLVEAMRMLPILNVGVDVAKDTVVVACAEHTLSGSRDSQSASGLTHDGSRPCPPAVASGLNPLAPIMRSWLT